MSVLIYSWMHMHTLATEPLLQMGRAMHIIATKYSGTEAAKKAARSRFETLAFGIKVI